MPVTNYYRTLGVAGSAGLEEIRAAYRQKARKYHPDVYAGNKSYATRKMKEINEAYNTLKNPAEREEYDRMLAASRPARQKAPRRDRPARKEKPQAQARTRRPAEARYPEQEVFFRSADPEFAGSWDLFHDIMSEMMDFMEEDAEDMLSSMILAMLR